MWPHCVLAMAAASFHQVLAAAAAATRTNSFSDSNGNRSIPSSDGKLWEDKREASAGSLYHYGWAADRFFFPYRQIHALLRAACGEDSRSPPNVW